MKNKLKPRHTVKCLDQNCDFHPKDLAAAMKKQEAAKPSPLPLGMIVDDRGHFEIRDDAGRGRTIAYAETHEDAALIVRAVNAHAGLVAALTALANVTGEKGMDRAVLAQLVADARAALLVAGEAV